MKECVTVSMPCFNCRSYLKKAVSSVLSQTYTNLILVVFNDASTDAPWDVLRNIHDRRLFRFNASENQSLFFAHEVVALATRDRYFLTHDADDWSEPRRLELLMRTMLEANADCVVSDLAVREYVNGSPHHCGIRSNARVREPLLPNFQHRADHHALFRKDALRRVGGYFGGFRYGYDTLLMNLLLMTSKVEYCAAPLYNYLRRQDSLTQSPNTGKSSPARAAVHVRLKQMFFDAYGHYSRFLDGKISSGDLSKSIRSIAARHVASQQRINITAESERLKYLIYG